MGDIVSRGKQIGRKRRERMTYRRVFIAYSILFTQHTDEITHLVLVTIFVTAANIYLRLTQGSTLSTKIRMSHK